jgi:hypothetical protein
LSTPAANTTGFPVGTYFEIRAKGSNNVLLTCAFSGEDGAQIQLWPRPSDGNELRAAVSILRLCRVLASPMQNVFQAFFIDRTGALCHGSGLNVDIVGKAEVSMTMTFIKILVYRQCSSSSSTSASHEPTEPLVPPISAIFLRKLSDPS